MTVTRHCPYMISVRPATQHRTGTAPPAGAGRTPLRLCAARAAGSPHQVHDCCGEACVLARGGARTLSESPLRLCAAQTAPPGPRTAAVAAAGARCGGSVSTPPLLRRVPTAPRPRPYPSHRRSPPRTACVPRARRPTSPSAQHWHSRPRASPCAARPERAAWREGSRAAPAEAWWVVVRRVKGGAAGGLADADVAVRSDAAAVVPRHRNLPLPAKHCRRLQRPGLHPYSGQTAVKQRSSSGLSSRAHSVEPGPFCGAGPRRAYSFPRTSSR